MNGISKATCTDVDLRGATLDPAGAILVEGHGSVGKVEVETPSVIRYGQMTQDELFVTAAAANSGVTVTNRSDKEDQVMLKHFGPGNPDAKGLKK